MINSFKGQYSWLSNFSPCRVPWDDLLFQSVETFYQAMKSDNPEVHRLFTTKSPRDAKSAGNALVARADWNDVRVAFMKYGLKCKFNWGWNPNLAQKLYDTGDHVLIEGNWWHDNFWGDCSCAKCSGIVGRNTLGMLLMDVRSGWLRTIVVNRRLSDEDVYIGRGSIWGNPFKVEHESQRSERIRQYEEYIRNKPELLNQLPKLRGKRLGCYCSPLSCHGDVLIKLMDERGII